VVANWELVLRLRRRREQLGLTVNDITKTLKFTRNYWSAIENERKLIPTNTLREIFKVLEFSTEDRRQLLALREEARKNGWWDEYTKLSDDNIQRLHGLEHGARGVRDYETLLIPGLLQTPEYAGVIMTSDVAIRPVEVKERVRMRLRRQELLDGDDPLHLEVIISEAALRQQVGGTEVLKGQLDHLLKMGERPNIEIRVIPFTATACDLFGSGTLVLLDFQSSFLPTVAWMESVTARSVITEPNQVRDITMAFNEAYKRSLAREDTIKMIQRARKELT
jgi:transcriptional regulator with XRE-family HTH domain